MERKEFVAYSAIRVWSKIKEPGHPNRNNVQAIKETKMSDFDDSLIIEIISELMKAAASNFIMK